jgi:hypothetical protein
MFVGEVIETGKCRVLIVFPCFLLNSTTYDIDLYNSLPIICWCHKQSIFN